MCSSLLSAFMVGGKEAEKRWKERGTRWLKWRGEAFSLAFILSDFCIVIVSLGSHIGLHTPLPLDALFRTLASTVGVRLSLSGLWHKTPKLANLREFNKGILSKVILGHSVGKWPECCISPGLVTTESQ